MNKKKLRLEIMSCIFLILLFSTAFSIHAEEDKNKFNPAVPEAFDYEKGDFTTITEWSKVLWEKIHAAKIPEIPDDKLEYKKLNKEQRFAMTVFQLQKQLEEIENIAVDVSEETAKQAIKAAKGVTVLNFGRNARIKQNVFIVENGAFSFDKKEGWEIKVDDTEKILILNPTEITELAIFTADDFTILSEIIIQSKQGSKATVKGLSFKNGQAYVKEGDMAIFNDYEIIAEKNPINVYFHTFVKAKGDYVEIIYS